MQPGATTRAAGDNINRATESIDGKHLDIVNMVLYQVKEDEDTRRTFGQSVESLKN